VVAVTGEWDRPPLPDEGQRRDVLAPLRAVRDSRVSPEERRAKVIDVIRGMAENGLDATATAELRGFIRDHKLLDLGSVESIVKEGRVVGRHPRHRLAAAGADPLPDEPLTEYGYARRFIKVHSGELRYVPEWKRWLVWDSKRWAHDTTGQAQRRMKSIARRVTAEVLASGSDEEFKATRRGETSAAVSGALTLASTEIEVVVSHEQLDTDPYLLNCANGTVDLRTGEKRDHDPADLITKLARGAYDPKASGSNFAAFLEKVQPAESMRAYLARLTGHGLIGRVIEHILPIFHGEGANGKSTYINAVEYALGDYAAPADPELLTARTFDAHPTGTADLFGVRLAILHETDRGRRLAEGTVKRLTGGDAIKARRMREDFWSFDPSHTFFMLTNHKPLISGTDEGIWRRIRLVPWNFVVPADQRDEHLGDKLALEADYVLTWLVKGCAEWRQKGLVDPEAVTKATEAYKTDSDAVGRFLDECCTKQQTGVGVGSTELFRAWEKWCAGESEEPGSHKAFSTELENRGYAKTATRTGVRWDKLGLLTDREEG
jgi:putative DNA primase/helicase